MSIDYDAFLDEIYDGLGVPAQFVSQDGIAADLTVKSETAGVVLDSPNSPLHLGSSSPAVCVRVSELTSNSITREQLKGSALTFNNESWKIVASYPKTKPTGGGEYILKLQST